MDSISLERILYDAVEHRLDISFEQFKKYIEGWCLTPIIRNREIYGVIMVKGPEIHIAALPQYKGKWALRGMTKFLLDLINKYGYASTKVMKDNFIGQEFVERLGFFNVGEDTHSIHYIIKKACHA